MRQNQKNNRMRNRPRKGGGGGNPANNLNRSYESNGPDVKVRGTPHHIAEKYQQLARDATSAGDRVAAENYYQHAEHYLRIIAAAQAQQAEMQERRRIEDERRREEEERWREEQERRRAERQERFERQGGGRQGDRGDEQPRMDGDQPAMADEMPRDANEGNDERPRRRRRANGAANGQDHAPEAGPDEAGPARASDDGGDVPTPRRRRSRKAPVETAAEGGPETGDGVPDGQAIAHALPGGGSSDEAEAPKPKRRRASPRRKAEGSDAGELSIEDA